MKQIEADFKSGKLNRVLWADPKIRITAVTDVNIREVDPPLSK